MADSLPRGEDAVDRGSSPNGSISYTQERTDLESGDSDLEDPSARASPSSDIDTITTQDDEQSKINYDHQAASKVEQQTPPGSWHMQQTDRVTGVQEEEQTRSVSVISQNSSCMSKTIETTGIDDFGARRTSNAFHSTQVTAQPGLEGGKDHPIDFTNEEDDYGGEHHTQIYFKGRTTDSYHNQMHDSSGSIVKDEEDGVKRISEVPATPASLHDIPECGNSLPGTEGPTRSDAIPVAHHSSEFTEDEARNLIDRLQTYTANTRGLAGNSQPSISRTCGDLELEDEDDDAAARRKFAHMRDAYQTRQANGEATQEDEIEFKRASEAEKARVKLMKSSKAFDKQKEDEDNVLFYPEDPLTDNEEEFDSMEQVVGQTEESHSLFQNEMDVLSAEAPSKRRRLSSAKLKPSVGKTKSESRVTKPRPKAKLARPKRGDELQFGKEDIRGLFQSNIIEQAQANQGKEAQPALGGGKDKRKALTALIASLPEDQRDLYRGDKSSLEKASQKFTGHGAMKADGDEGWLLRGMNSRLHHYQMIGASWMRVREGSSPKGGILGDTMGFGKTVMCLTNIVDGRPPATHRGPRATLIVAPSALMTQWLNEITKHVAPGTLKDVMLYKSGNRVMSTDPARTLGMQDIVITSYNEVLKSMPRNEPPPEVRDDPEKRAAWWKEHFEQHKGALHTVKWYRIVLDEAQAIKNHKSMTSVAVRALSGRFRWCLSGTPIQNSIEEFFPFFHFLRCEATGVGYDLFKQNFCKRGSERSMQRLQALLQKLMLRRGHQTQMFGRPILQLPPIKPVRTVEVPFNAIERAVYQIVRSRFVEKVKLIGLRGGAHQNYQQIFVLLLRLRQLVGHPLLIQKTLKEVMESEDIERLWALTATQDLNSRSPAHSAITQENDDGNKETVAALRVALSNAEMNSGSPKSTMEVADNESSKRFREYLRSLSKTGDWAKANEKSLCHACGNPPERPYLTPCLHLYCFSCLDHLWYSQLHKGESMATCNECGTRFQKCNAYQPRNLDEDSSRRETPSSSKKGSCQSGESAEEDIDWFNLPGPILRSAKVKGAMRQIDEWLKQDKSNKIIVFVQFRGLIKVMSRVLREERIRSVTFDGSMSYEARDEAIKKFSGDPEVSVLLAAMKAGGIGLNLTAANRVIILDLWWNYLTESQAFCRAYRIGQTRDVEVVRFVVKNSIDTDMLAMQERKTKEINTAMDEKNWPKLTITDLLSIFGDDSTHDKDGETRPYGVGEDEPFVFPENSYDQDEDGDEANDEDDVETTGID